MEILNVQKKKCLFDLIEQGDHERALELLKGDNHFTEEELNKSLISACQEGYKFIVQMLVRLGADVNYRSTNGNTPLLISVQNGLMDIVQFLITSKADVNASNSVGNTALILSIHPSGSTEITANLLKQPGINIDHQNQDGYTAIMKAAEVKNVDALKILLDRYCNIHSTSASKPRHEFVAESKTHEHTSNSVTHDISQWTTLGETVNYKGENIHQIAERCGIGGVFKQLQEHIITKISHLELAIRGSDIKSFNIFLDCDFVYAFDKKCLDKVFLNIFQTCSEKDSIHFNEKEIAMIKALLEHGAKVNTNRKDTISCKYRSDSPLFLLKRSIYWNKQKDPIQIAAESGCFKVLELLLSFKADVGSYDFPDSPLHIALSHGHTECAKLLIQHGAKLDFQRALKLAVDQQEPKYVRFLIENYKDEAKKFFRRNSEVTNIFLTSVRKGNLEIIGQILDLGADINSVMDSYMCPLAESKNGDVAKFLIDRGANVNYIVNCGAISTTPLNIVLNKRDNCDSSVVEVIQVLLEHGASVNYRDCRGKTALMLAAIKEGSGSMLQLLLDHGAELGERDVNGVTALMYAVCNGCPQNVLLLLQFITDRKQLINVQNNCGLTALMYAISIRNKSIIKQLIDQGADVNIKDINSDSALHFLLRSGKHEDEILRSLIQAGCDINCQNNKGMSPLMMAAEKCLRDTISLLLDSGAEINAVSKNDVSKTALAHLLNRPHLESANFNCLEYLLDRGASSSYVEATTFHKMIYTGQIQLIPKLIRCGFGPASINPYKISSLIVDNIIMPSWSPLFTALYVGNCELSRFFVGNMFLTHSDVSLLSHNKLMRQHLERKNYKECLDFLNELSTQPMNLFNLSFVVVSTAVGTAPGREIRVNELPLPQIVKDKLLFKLQDVELTVPEESITDLSSRMPRSFASSSILLRNLSVYLQNEHYSRHLAYADSSDEDYYDDDTNEYDFFEHDDIYVGDSD